MYHRETFRRPSWGILTWRGALATGITGIWFALTPPLINAQCRQPVMIPNPSWMNLPRGGPPKHSILSHKEREFKFGFRGTGLSSFTPLQLAQVINDELNQVVQNDNLWKAPRLVSGNPNNPVRYEIRLTGKNNDEIGDDYFFDVYFDTRDDLNYILDVIYRFRQRFDTKKHVDNYLAGIPVSDFVPEDRIPKPPVNPLTNLPVFNRLNVALRSESVSKVGRTVLEPGLNVTTEHRVTGLDFAPARQISVSLCEFQLGLFDGERTLSADELVEFLTQHAQPPFSFFPKLIVLSERRRQHLLLPTIVGDEIKPDPGEAMLITVDRAEVFEVEAMLAFMRGDRLTRPEARGSFIEVEVEFEHNVSHLFEDSEGNEKPEDQLTPKEKEFKSALLTDQRTIMDRLRAKFARNGNSLALQPEIRSKYTQAYEILFNRAEHKPVRQSSTEVNATANRAVDGSTDGNFSKGSVTHTRNEFQPFWEVNLGRRYTISSVEIWNRTDCCSDRLQNFYLIISDQPIDDSMSLEDAIKRPDVTAIFFSGPAEQVLRASSFVPGRFVRIQLVGENALSLAEIKVFGHESVPNPPIINLARDHLATDQSSTALGAGADRAVDDNTNGNFDGGSVTHTLLENRPFWQLDLGSIQNISSFEIWNRTDCCADRLQNFFVIVSADPITSANLDEVLAQPGVTVTHFPGLGTHINRASITARGRYVRVQLDGRNALHLAEVKVFGHH